MRLLLRSGALVSSSYCGICNGTSDASPLGMELCNSPALLAYMSKIMFQAFRRRLRNSLDQTGRPRYCGFIKKTLVRLVRECRVPAIRVAKHWRFRASTLNLWLAGQETGIGSSGQSD
jgi:hypothetical protein